MGTIKNDGKIRANQRPLTAVRRWLYYQDVGRGASGASLHLTGVHLSKQIYQYFTIKMMVREGELCRRK
jgi:hypothetical protein